MSNFYMDSSALFKNYSVEAGSLWIQALFQEDHRFFTARLSYVEFGSALAWYVREETLSADDQQSALRMLAYDMAKNLRVVELDAATAVDAAQVAIKHFLQVTDSIQLACALRVNAALLAIGAEPLIFLSADRNLLKAATDEGLNTDNPENHFAIEPPASLVQ